MSFFPLPAKQKGHRGRMKENDVRIYQQLGCDACPLAKLRNRHPHMDPYGSDKPVIYVLGSAPNDSDDVRGRPCTGRNGEFLKTLLREVLGSEYKGLVRFNNVVRTRPEDPTKPPWEAIEACRPSVIADIEQTRPKAIFGLGDVPLEWTFNASGIYAWRGRAIPVKIGSHVCWYFPLFDPEEILNSGYSRFEDNDEAGDFTNEDHRMLKLDIEKAWQIINGPYSPTVHTAEQAFTGIEIIDQCDETGLAKIEEGLNRLSKAAVVGVDYETTDLRPYNDKVLVLSAAVSDGNYTLSFPFDHPGAEWKPEHRKQLTKIWRKFIKKTKAIKAVHNLQFEMEWTVVKFGEDLARAGRWECTQVQASIIDHRYKGTDPGPLSLDFLVRHYFGLELKKLSGVDRRNLINTPMPHVLSYNGLDAKYHCLLYRRQTSIIRKEKLDMAYRYAIRRVPTLVLAQIKGVPVDQARVKQLQKKYEATVSQLEAEIAADKTVRRYEKTVKKGEKFNPYSNSDCVGLFYKMLGRKECEVYDRKSKVQPWFGGVDGRTKVNKVSCDKDVLTQLEHPLANKILQLRQPQKLLSTYILPALRGSEFMYDDGKFHTIFNHTFTDTGRLSSEAPNLQNFPKRSEGSKEVRQIVRPPKGHVVLSIDYGQIEARVIAMYTRDKVFCKALWERYDVHQEWAERIAYAYPARIGGKKFLKDKAVMKALRTDIKNQWTFPLFFGASLPSAAKYLHIPEDVLEPLYNEFWYMFEGVKTWQNELMKFYNENGYVATFTGRRRYGPMSPNKVYNSPVQGFTCEFVLDGMCRLSETGDPLLQPEIQIHDDLTWVSVPAEKVDYVAEKALEILLTPSDDFKDFICVPITLEMSVGDDWLHMEDIGVFSSDDK